MDVNLDRAELRNLGRLIQLRRAEGWRVGRSIPSCFVELERRKLVAIEPVLGEHVVRISDLGRTVFLRACRAMRHAH